MQKQGTPRRRRKASRKSQTVLFSFFFFPFYRCPNADANNAKGCKETRERKIRRKDQKSVNEQMGNDVLTKEKTRETSSRDGWRKGRRPRQGDPSGSLREEQQQHPLCFGLLGG